MRKIRAPLKPPRESELIRAPQIRKLTQLRRVLSGIDKGILTPAGLRERERKAGAAPRYSVIVDSEQEYDF